MTRSTPYRLRDATRRGAARCATVIAVAVAVAVVLSLAAMRGADARADTVAALSEAQWRKIEAWLEKDGRVRTLPSKVAEHLGLTKGSETLTVRELAIDRDGYQHGIYKSVEAGEERIVLAFRTPEKHWTAFATDRRFRLVAAIVWDAGEAPTPWTDQEAQPAFRNEIVFWSVIADLL